MAPRPLPSVVAACHLPLPVTGFSAVSARVLAAMEARGLLAAAVRLSRPKAGAPGSGQGRLRGLSDAILALAAARRNGARVFYQPVDGGLGKLVNLALIVWARLLGYRLVLHHHSFAYLDRRSRLPALMLRAAPPGTLNVVLCSRMGELLLARYPEAAKRIEVVVVGNGFMAAPIVAKPARSGVFNLAHLSNLTRAKGLAETIAVFEAMRDQGRDVRLLLAGPAGEPEAKALIDAARARHGERIEWLGTVEGEAKTGFFARVDVFLFPSQYANEAQPLVLIEALAAGCPILSIARGCIACDHDESVGLIAGDSADFLARAPGYVADLIDQPAKLIALSMAAQAAAARLSAEGRRQLDALLDRMA